MKKEFLISVMLTCAAAPPLPAQDLPCQAAYAHALELYNAGNLDECLADIHALDSTCVNDPAGKERMLMLKAVVLFRSDSMDLMRSTLEQLLRTTRHPAITSTDPLIVDHYPVWASYNEDVKPKFKKDQGRLRAGAFFTSLRNIVDAGTKAPVLEGDGVLEYQGSTTVASGATVEWEIIPNLSARLSGTYEHMAFTAKSATLSYAEDLEHRGTSIGLKKAFWLGRSPWVPYAMLRGGYGRVISCRAEVGRNGDGLRYLAPKTVDRLDQRTRNQMWIGGGAGVGRKLGSLIVYVEGAFDLALMDMTKKNVPYVESELLTNYYYVDAPLRLHKFGLTLGVQYVLQYHRHNRLYP
ncbi:MAG TPA: hypothetical protein PK760_00845 [Flavobacteriales bacterium]|nr:hypothetical protein [Flavobacteriales bacterium]